MRDDLAALAHKYRTIAALRRERAAGGDVAPREVLRALADDHPGALAELDRMPMELVESRAEALEAAARGGPAQPWMEWMAALRARYRAALRVKALLGGQRDPSDERVEAIVQKAAAQGWVGVDAELVRSVARPALGRVRAVVLASVAGELGVDAAELDRTLFPWGKGRSLPKPRGGT